MAEDQDQLSSHTHGRSSVQARHVPCRKDDGRGEGLAALYCYRYRLRAAAWMTTVVLVVHYWFSESLVPFQPPHSPLLLLVCRLVVLYLDFLPTSWSTLVFCTAQPARRQICHPQLPP